MSKIVGKIIEKNVTQPAADDDAEDKHQVEVFEMDGKSIVFIFLDLFAYQEVRGQKTKDVHKTVPAHMEWPKTKDYRIDIRKMHRVGLIGVFFLSAPAAPRWPPGLSPRSLTPGREKEAEFW